MRPLFFDFIASVSLLFHFLSNQLLDASAFAFVRDLLKQQTVMSYVLASDETVQGQPLGSPPGKIVGYESDELWNTVIKTYPAVGTFWTYDKAKFLAQPVYSRDSPLCKYCE